MDEADRAARRQRAPRGGRRMVIQMKKVWTRNAALGTYDGVNASDHEGDRRRDRTRSSKNPDSREKHRALVQALSYAGELDEARDVANRWLERDKLDPQALGYIADILGRDGKRELALRTLAGLVDLDPDRANAPRAHDQRVRAHAAASRRRAAIASRSSSLTTKEAAKRAGAAARCLRSLGRTADADLVMASLVDDKARTEAEKLATVAPVDAARRAATS